MTGAIRHLAEHGRVFTVDIVGMPGKSAGIRFQRGGDGYPRWLEAVLDGLSVESAASVGVSFGGWLVLKLAAVAPRRIRAARTICSSVNRVRFIWILLSSTEK